MAEDRPEVDVLVVDDRPEQLLAIAAVLEPLDVSLVTATSGREALRHVLRQPFALILLDINMPGMDGFEAANMIRAYGASREAPIIFMTAADERLHLDKSYAVGAVDYILTPVVPDLLRSKVRVFADLYRKTAEIERQRMRLEQQATRLHRLTEASVAINSLLTLDGILQATTEAARKVTGAHQAATMLELHPGAVQDVVSLSDKYASYRERRATPPTGQIYGLTRGSRAVRLSQREVEARAELEVARDAPGLIPLRGLLVVPLTQSDGQVMGQIQVSDKDDGDFSEGDEEGLIQLAQLGSIAVQNCLHAEAREANRLKDEFLATLSHELRTPLHAILGWTRLLREGSPDPARMARGLQVIERNVNVQTALIEDLLDVSRIATGKLRLEKRHIDLAPVVEAALDTIRPTAEAKGVLLALSIEPGLERVMGDAERLGQVMGNLLGNAVKFTAGGGRVEVLVRRDGSEVEIVVADTGAGIVPEFLPFVFERFRQADSTATRQSSGLGLGLALVHSLVKLHGGTVRAESPGQGRGATFTVRIPELPKSPRTPALLRQGAPAPARDLDLAPPSSGELLRGLHVLVVDDDDDARELLRELLCQYQAEVTTARSARDALAAIAAQRPHVLVSDIAMAGEDGYELIRRVRTEATGPLPALALTAFARPEDRDRALEAGFQMHASKPIEPTVLVAAVRSLADGAQTL